ncbi:aminopeptidase N-like [Ochlerotatus camptorhynchus]|uniref:aminopeptidase N-like n=1 Tax=Ochlerotatus camptorhynchus TaxID=644619 RepID=UPI0031D2457B
MVIVLSLVVAANGEYHKRLPTNVIPKHYSIELSLDVHTGNESYRGNVDIVIDVLKPISEIVLHGSELTIASASLVDLDKSALQQSLSVNTDTENKLLIMTSHWQLQTGSYLLMIEFHGITSKTSEGMYIIAYKEPDGIQKHFLSTQFEPHNARTVFPCFDEPALKATFNVSIIHHRDLNAMSNMPLIGAPVTYSPDNQKFVVSRFKQTPKMSTYLLVFLVSDFTVRSEGDTAISARTEFFEDADYVLQLGNDAVRVLNEYTGIPYTNFIPNITHVFLPVERDFGKATEFWGLISYQEKFIAYNSAMDGFERRSASFQIVAHELAHQWFGNLVSVSWWNHVWMKEGMATLYQYYVLHLAYPEERYMDLYNVESLQTALIISGRAGPLFKDESNVPYLQYYYPQSMYVISGSVLNMIRLVIGNQKWQMAMRNYLENHKFESTVPEDLYREIEAVANNELNMPRDTTLKQIFDSWFSSSGEVVLNVHRNYSQGQIKISQATVHNYKPSVRIIPYNYAHDPAHFDRIEPIQWLISSQEILATNVSDDQWMIFNKRQFGFYRVNYDERNWRLIIKALRTNISSINPLNRVQLLDDAYNLYKVRKLNPRIFLELLTYMRNETDCLPWYKTISILNFLHTMTGSETLFKAFAKHLSELFYQTVSSDDGPAHTAQLEHYVQSEVAKLVCWTGNELCHQHAKEKLHHLINSNSSIQPDWLTVVYCFGLHNSGDEELNWLISKYLRTSNEREEDLLINAFTCAGNTGHLRQVLVSLYDKNAHDAGQLQFAFEKFASLLRKPQVEGQLERLVSLLENDPQLSKRLGTLQVNTLLIGMDFLAGSVEQREVLKNLARRLSPGTMVGFRGYSLYYMPNQLNVELPKILVKRIITS